MKKVMFLVAWVFFTLPALAATPYNAAATGMAFLSKDMAKSFYSVTVDRDNDAQMAMMIDCTARGVCIVVDEGTPIFLEQQAEYPLVQIRIKGSPTKYWALNNIIPFD